MRSINASRFSCVRVSIAYDVESPVLAEKTDCAGDTLPSPSFAEVKAPLEKALAPLPVPDCAGDTLPSPFLAPVTAETTTPSIFATSPLPGY